MSKQSKLFLISGTLIIFLITLLLVTVKGVNHDVYHYLLYGRDISTSGIPYENIHNITPGLKLVLQEWLYDYLIYSIYSMFGWVGLSVFECILYAGIFTILGVFLTKKPVSTLYKLGSLLVISLPIAFSVSIRAYTVSILLLLLQICFIKSKHFVWIFPLLLLMEINLHASFWVFHYLLLIPYLLPWRIPEEISKKRLIIVALYSLPIMLLNPYGIDNIIYPFKAYTSGLLNLGITELATPSINSIVGIVVGISLILFTLTIKHISGPAFYMYIITLVLVVLHGRNFFFISFGLLLLLYDWYKINNLKPLKCKPYILNVLLSIIGMVLTVLVVLNIGNIITRCDSNAKYEFPNIVRYLNAHNVTKVGTTFNTGTYLEWNGFKVYIDSCPEVFAKTLNEKKDILMEYIHRADNDYELLNSFQYLCTNDTNVILELKYKPGWIKRVVDNNVYLYENLKFDE